MLATVGGGESTGMYSAHQSLRAGDAESTAHASRGRQLPTSSQPDIAHTDDQPVAHVARIRLLQQHYGNQAVGSLLRSLASGPPLQRYTEVTLEGRPWRLSDQRNALVRSAEGNEAPKDLYATEALLNQARQQLEQAHSFVTLTNVGEKTLKFRGDRLATEQDVRTAAYFAGRKKRGDATASESESVSDYYQAQDELLGQGVETSVTLRQVMARYTGPVGNNPENQDRPGGYARLAQKIQQTGVLNTPADCNETARVIMGVVSRPTQAEAEVAVKSNGGVDQASAREDTDLRKPGNAAASLVESGGLSALRQSLVAYAAALPHRPISAQPAQQLAVAGFPAFLAQNPVVGANTNPAFAFRKLYDLQQQFPVLYRDFTLWAGLDAAISPRVGDALVTYLPEGAVRSAIARHPRLYTALRQALVNVRHVSNEQAEALLTGLGITTNSTFDRIVTLLTQEGVGMQLGEQEDIALLQAQGENDLWNKHWAGVIMTDGSDYVSLENDASTAGQGEFNTAWRFVLYGSVKQGQSFHEHMMASQDFGTFATTTRFRHP